MGTKNQKINQEYLNKHNNEIKKQALWIEPGKKEE